MKIDDFIYKLSRDEIQGLNEATTELQIAMIEKALFDARGEVSTAARYLNTNRTTLVEKIRKFSLQEYVQEMRSV